MMIPVDSLLSDAKGHRARTGRPLTTLSYAQSLDGSIALYRGERTELSGSESLALSHRLRSAHDAVLVGIGTILSDGPQLNVRLVPGSNPLPVVLDSSLRFPMDGNPLLNATPSPLVVTLPGADGCKSEALEDAGVRVLRVKPDAEGRVDVKTLVTELGRMGLDTLMVEGGAKVITSFLSEGLVDLFVITVVPRMIGGLHAVESGLTERNSGLPDEAELPEFVILGSERSGPDLVVWGRRGLEAK